MNPNQYKQTEQFWHERIFQSDLILQSIAEGIFVIDTEENIVFANAFAAKNLGYPSSAELLGEHYGKILFNREKHESFFCPIKFALTEGENSHVNTETFFRRSGSEFLVEYVCVPLSENEEIIGAIVSFKDITERRDIETAIAEARDTALENVRARAGFLANISHEIRTPLNGIIGTTELLLNTELKAEQKNYGEMLRTSAESLLEIVNEILDFSKIEAGKLKPEVIEFDVKKVFGETLDLFSALAKRKNLAFHHETDEKIPSAVRGDSSRLRQVLNNLFSNAVKFTEKGEIRAKLSIKEEVFDSISLLFEIADTGIGIEPQAQNSLFQPFAQADISTTRKYGGTGLGLAICRRIVEMMNGEIGLESQPGSGSRFWFTAKFLKKSEALPQPKIPPDISREVRSQQSAGRNPRVLVVEDNPINREIIKIMFRQIGVETETAENGLIAVELCRSQDFDIILMDCRMPEMDGFEATRQIISQSLPNKTPKIIALTASATDEERGKCFAAGMTDFLTKPVRLHYLKSLVENFQIEQNPLQNLDLTEKFVQHSLAEIISSEILKNLEEIESGGEENFVREMLELFCNHTESELSELNKAFLEKNTERIRQISHNLKGSSANIGVKKLPELFEKLEKKTLNKNAGEIGETISEIAAVFNQIKTIIRKNYENG